VLAEKPNLQEAAERSRNRQYFSCCCSHINSHNPVRGVTGLVPVTLEQRNTLGKNTNNPRLYTHKSQLTQFMPPPETYKSEIGSQYTMCQVHTGAYVSLLAPEKTDYTACHRRKTTTYISHVVSITTHTHNRRKSIGKKKKEQRIERKGNGCMGPRKRKEK